MPQKVFYRPPRSRYVSSSGAAAAALLLDTYDGAAVAYSVRKLRTAYAGSALRVRRSSDNTEQDIGFSGDDINSAALAAFCAGTDGFVTVWYDQSANGNNAVQTTAANQPKIVTAGTVLTESAKAAPTFDGSNDTFALNTPVTGDAPWASYCVMSRVSSLCGFSSNTVVYLPFTLLNFGPSFVGVRDAYSSVATFPTARFLAEVYATANNGAPGYFVNGSSETPTVAGNTSGNSFDALGNRSTTTHSGVMQEAVIWSSDKTADATAIRANINAYFSIY